MKQLQSGAVAALVIRAVGIGRRVPTVGPNKRQGAVGVHLRKTFLTSGLVCRIQSCRMILLAIWNTGNRQNNVLNS